MVESGELVSNTWVIYPGAGNNPSNEGLIPHTIGTPHEEPIKGGDLRTSHSRMSLRPISLLVR